MKIILLDILANDTSYAKSATRYLCRTHPDLWDAIVTATLFLPNDAKPKQRVWHIVNDIYSIPLCPLTALPVKWFDNRYFMASSGSARTTWLNKTGKLRNQTEAAKAKRRQSIIDSVETRIKPPPLSVEQRELQQQRAKQTFMENYGVDNPSKAAEIKQKLSDANVAAGATPKHLRTARKLYYDKVVSITKISWREHFDKINPTRINRTTHALDHIYSIQAGFRENISPAIIGHWTNLRIIGTVANSAKGMRCDKTLEELHADYQSSLLDNI